ncbi:hypothetical protein [Arundinibacter roseus]|uniref:Uncharacterized protein n=1 Tax=Arundinibacter roseus TaxID=2070510 RepID=A0A4R4K9T6_9BACT|nr:hypothetical protein [Arundinibacter roseus]TDB64604.1 hypothetical protein EZE20_13110 [Arundinibacter roseus]
MAEPDKSFGKKILGFFIKEEENAVKQPVTQASIPASPPTPPTPAVVSNSSGTATVERKFVDHFVALMEKANLPGPDYFEYKQALKSMEGLGLTEEKQFQASWGSFKAMGGVVDPTVLTTSANQYVNILTNDRTNFLKDVEKAIQDRVGSLSQEHKKLEDDNKAFAEQILALQKKIETNSTRLNQIKEEIDVQSAKITENRDSYEVTYKSFVEQIQSDLNKIKTYLK